MRTTVSNVSGDDFCSKAVDVGAYQAGSVKTTFADLGLGAEVSAALETSGISHPFEIQELAIPPALKGHDIVAQAKTGTGKTFAFALPAITLTQSPGDSEYQADGAPQSLIIAPTRELATQITNDIKLAAKNRLLRITAIYGGTKYESQIEQLRRGTDIVIGTPGRLLDLYQQKYLLLDKIRMVVLDEADEMLNLGFLDDVGALLSATPKARQTMLFSATMPGPIVAISREYMHRAIHIHATSLDDEGLTGENVHQLVYRVHSLDKDEIIGRILQAEGRGRTIVFTSTKRVADKLKVELEGRGFAVNALHGDLSQQARERSLDAFRKGTADVLVATDIAARGIDIDDITHVINYQVPEDETIYVHRIGRTARAGNAGVAITFVDWGELPRWSLINKALDLGIAEPEETYSTSPHLFKELSIPEGTKGSPRNRSANASQPGNRRKTDHRAKNKAGKNKAARRSGRKVAIQGKTVPANRHRKRTRTINGETVDGR